MRKLKDFICKTCSTVAGADDAFPMCITIVGDELETVNEFWYLGDIIGQAEWCIDVTARVQSACKAFHELLPILTNRSISLLNAVAV